MVPVICFWRILTNNLNTTRHPELPLSKVILWKPVHGHRGRGRPRATFVDNLLLDTGVETTGELETLMLDRMVWRRVILDPRAAPADPP